MATFVLPGVTLSFERSEIIIQYENFRKEKLKQLKSIIFRAHVKIAAGVVLGLNLKLETLYLKV